MNEKSKNLQDVEARLASDLGFARVTFDRCGENLLHWLPRLTEDEIQAATATAVALIDKQLTKTTSASMSSPGRWLADIASSREQEARTERENEQALKNKANEVDSVVTALLTDVGRAYWGSVGKQFVVKRYGTFWEVQEGEYESHYYWRVSLRRDEEGFKFKVAGGGEAITTDDLTTRELQAALRLAIEKGRPGWYHSESS